jgi:hypothetical protein
MKEAAKKAASVNDILEHGLVHKGNKYGIKIVTIIKYLLSP